MGAPTVIRFTAPEHRAGATIGFAAYEFGGTTRDGWEVRREGRPHLRLGPGYRLLRSRECGVCSTDLARHHLPFPLPQVTGHEVVAEDDGGGLVAVEINASHVARALPRDAWCGRCRAGLPTHCDDRLVLGIHGLPGGFSPWILAPVEAVVPLPASLPPGVGVLLEPFAAAWHAVETIAPATADVVAVLGVGRLGTLIVAALAAYRRQSGTPFGIIGIVHDPVRPSLARAVGADEVWGVEDALAHGPSADVVVETTGTPGGLESALGLARREVHLKSTTGEPAGGLRHATELVVDEIRIVPAGAGALPEGPSVRRVSTLAEIDAAIRPDAAVARAAVGPRGTFVLEPGPSGGPLCDAIGRRGLRLTTSRCGDFGRALPVFVQAAGAGLEGLLGRVTSPAELAQAYAAAAEAGAGKIVVRHPA